MKTLYKLIPKSLILMTGLIFACGIPALAAPTAQGVINGGPPSGNAAAQPGADLAPDIDLNSYLLTPSDQLDIDLPDQDGMRRTVTILQDGTFNYPVVGAVKAAGMTVTQLANYLDKHLSERYNQPQVTVSVLSTHTRRISVTGAVKAPGEYPYRPGLHLLELLAACGGPAQAPELTQATLITNHGQNSTPVDLVKLLTDGDQTQNVVLAPGDSILFSPKDPAASMIHVVGQVNKPGDYGVVANGATVMAMLTEAGGPTGAAAMSQAQILRHDGGATQTIDLHPLKYNLNDPAGKIRLAAGDTLLIPENNNKIYVLGEVRSNSAMFIPDGETLTVTEALAQAGGPNDDGDKKQVGIIRHTPTGTGVKSTLIEVNVQDLLKNENQAKDVALQPGDYLIVPTRHHGHNALQYLSSVGSAAWSLFNLSRF